MAARMSLPNSATGPPDLATGSSGHLATGPSVHSATESFGHSGSDDDTISATWPPGRSAGPPGHSAGPLGLSQLFSVMNGHVSTHAHLVGVLMDVGAQRLGASSSMKGYRAPVVVEKQVNIYRKLEIDSKV